MPNLNFWGKLNTLREGIKFDQDRKLKIRDYLIREINISVSTENINTSKKRFFWSGFIKSSHQYQFRFMPVLAGIVMVIIFGGGVSLGAESSLPGDLLYPIKLGVNEQVLGSLIFNDKANAEWESSLAMRRLEEAELLTLSGKIDEATQARIEDNFEKHSKKVSDSIARMQLNTDSTDAAEITSKFESSLRAHEQIIRKLGDNSSNEIKSRIRPVEAKVKNRLQQASSKRSELDSSIASRKEKKDGNDNLKNTAERKINSAVSAIDSLEKFIERKKEKLSLEVIALAENRIKSARSFIELAKEKNNSESSGEAFNLAQSAIRTINEARLLVNASTELKLDGGLKDENEAKELEVENKNDVTVRVRPSSLNNASSSKDVGEDGEDDDDSRSSEGDDNLLKLLK